MHHLLCALTLVFILCFTSSACSLTNTTRFSSYQLFSISDGLSQVSVQDIEQDQNGYIWIATQAGLDRFDGYQFVNSDGLINSSGWMPKGMVQDIELDESTGDLWFASRDGLYVLRSGNTKFESVSKVLLEEDDLEVMAIHADDFGNIWVGTMRGVYVLYKGRASLEILWSKSNTIGVFDLALSPNNVLWVATNDGVMQFDTQEQTWLERLLPSEMASIIYFDTNGNAWLGTSGNGVFWFESAKNEGYNEPLQFSLNEGLVNPIVNDIKQDAQSNIWIATVDGISIASPIKESTKHLAPYSFETVQSFDPSSKNASISNVLSLHMHSEELVFAGTIGKGFFVADYAEPLFNSVVLDKGIISYSVTVQKDDLAWVSSENGVYKFSDKYKVEGPFNKTLNGDSPLISNIMQDAHYSSINDEIYLASRIGLKRFNYTTLEIENMAFPKALLYSISETPEGLLLLSTRSMGFYLYDPRNESIIHHWDMPLSFNAHFINPQTILVPTTNGLYKIDLVSFDYEVFKHNEDEPDSLPYNVVTWVSKYKENEYFVGTQSKGLQLMEYENNGQPPSFRPILPHSDLGRLSIGAVVPDANNNYWVTTTQSIAKLSGNLNEITFFGESDGVNSSGYFISSFAQDSKGYTYFAGADGLTHFKPEEILAKANPPKLQFTVVKTLNSHQEQMNEYPLLQNSQQGKLILSPNNLMLSIEFAANEYKNAENIEYAYKLEGFHNTWQYAPSRSRIATFTHLLPGKYTFKVKSTDRYQNWYNKPISLSITVPTPWWETDLAIFIWLSILCFFAYSAYKWRMFTIYQRERKLTNLVNEKTADLETANEKLRQLSIRDPLTQLLNRRGFTQLAEREYLKFVRDKQNFSIVLLDIDHFKEINDNYGHDFGDEVLIEVANLLKSSLRSVDILARWGGEEFIVLLPDTNVKGAAEMSDKVRAKVIEFNFGSFDEVISVSFSAGVCEILANESLDNCISEADKRLYKAKERGRNLVCTE
ncbi:diguanylate cyclase [Glaciecola sp. 2405UD65-10]|uniref:ligand-binding sensor domain-containing diguanylate cyclase n=1 Tax=Glaciecola sp. 2405UD65-10 TaxID=3397244 RepID=UPI003B5CFBA0